MRAVNLIPSDGSRAVAVGGGRSHGAAFAVLGLLGGLAIFALLYGVAHHQISSRRAEVATLTARTQRAQSSAEQLSPYTSFLSLREQRMQAVSQLVDSRFDWAHAMHELGRVLPEDASITTFDGTVSSSAGSSASSGTPASSATSSSSSTATPAASAVSSATPPGSVPTFTLGGCATSQAEVALTLQRLRLMDGVSTVSLQSSAKASAGGASAAGTEGCGAGRPTFTVQVTFDPLPAAATGASNAPATTATSANGAGQ
jgi:Tfp pilus assembly protein PilN